MTNMRGFQLASVLLCVMLGCSSAKPFAKNVKSLKPAEQEMQFDLAQANEKDGQLAKAEAGYRELCGAKPGVSRYHQRWGVVLTRIGQRQEGLAALERAHRLEPNNTNILNDLGYAYLKTGESTKAAELFRKTLEFDPQNKCANNNLALALGYEGDLKESFRMFQNTLPEADALTNLGYVATQNGNTELAVKAYSRALTLDPDKRSAAEALTQLALLDQDVEQTRSIAHDLNSLNERSSEDPAGFPLNRTAPAKLTTIQVNHNSPKVPVTRNALRKESISQATAVRPSAKVMPSSRDE
ncbi:MAG: tetratricopeptide repeat protein [Planctomycetota bacterium]|nr:MAG: tetratricopeptide repeat protein [Planctomycetota bacterium]GDY11000.1 hypothetical protein LBMAG52_44880 [Planctomycetia bacterium]